MSGNMATFPTKKLVHLNAKYFVHYSNSERKKQYSDNKISPIPYGIGEI